MNRVLWYVGRRRPLLFFGLPGLFLLAAGLVAGVFVVNVVLQKHATPIGAALISVFLCLGGALTAYTGLILSAMGRLEATVRGVERGVDPSLVSDQAPASSGPVWPLLLFGIPGMLGLLAGLAWGIWAVSIFLASRGIF